MNKRVLYIISVLVVVIAVLLFFVTRFYSSTLITYDGYFVSGSKINSQLMSEEEDKKVDKVKLNKMSSDDDVVTNYGKYYLNDGDKKLEINTDYPVFINNGLGLVNYSDKNKLVNDRFDFFDTYENITITDGKIYNYGDNEQADFENYIFLQIRSDGTFINLVPLVIKSSGKERTVKVNSIINFQDEYLNYFYYDKNGKLIYDSCDGISLEDTILIGEKEYTYLDLLIGIGKKDPPSEVIEREPEKYVIKNEEYQETYVNNTVIVKVKKEVDYAKPSVTSDNFDVGVYTAKNKIKISDPAGRITGGINFTFYNNDKVYSRKTFVSSGDIRVVGLKPNTDFYVVGSFRYYDEDGKKIELEFLHQNIRTGDFASLDPIDLSFYNGELYPDRIVLNGLKITSDMKNEALYGVNKGVVVINGDSLGFSSSVIKEILNGREATYMSPTSLDSSSSYHYKIYFYDGFGNRLNILNNEGNTRTSRVSPTASFVLDSSEVGKIHFSISLKNPDNVNIASYRYVIYDGANNIASQGALDSSLEKQSLTNSDLNPNTTYIIRILGTFNTEDGLGTKTDVVMGEGKFVTLPLSLLGFIRTVTKITDLSSSHAEFTFYFDLETTSPALFSILTSYNVDITGPDNEVCYSKEFTGEELQALINGETATISVDDLSSSTDYYINYVGVVTQGTITDNIKVVSEITSFATYRKDAYVEVKDKFVNNDMIIFDVRVVDVDNAIESGRVILEVRDRFGVLVAMESLEINAGYRELSYTKLESNVDYYFKYYAEEYNIGYENFTYQSDFVLLRETINTEDGLSGSIELQSMLRQITGINLFDINDLERIRKEGNTGYKKYNLDNDSVMFGAKNGYVNFSYYLPEAVGYRVTVSFDAMYDTSTEFRAKAYLYNNFNNSTSYSGTTIFNKEIADISDSEWKSYSFNFIVESPYIGFLINAPSSKNERTNVWFKNINIFTDQLTTEAQNNIQISYYDNTHIFRSTVMASGKEEMPSWRDDSTVVGNYGDGHARITNTSTGEVVDFSYTGSEATYVVQSTGSYRIQLWGAAGGDGSLKSGYDLTKGSHGGRGAYTAGTISLSAGETLYFYVGGRGLYGSESKVKNSYKGPVGGWNGGGNGGNSGSGSGGGATDVRLVNGAWNNVTSLQSRIMVAGGGGGADDWGGNPGVSNDGSGGAGGALESEGAYINGVLLSKYKATQTMGYQFGVGQNVSTNTDTGGAGGGWFGGLVSNNNNGGGAGGTSYISGYLGCVSYAAINRANTEPVEYTQFAAKDTFLASFIVNLTDLKEEIQNGSYFVRVYLDGEEVIDSPFAYPMSSRDVEHEVVTFALKKNKNYKVVLSVNIRDKYYDLSSYEFNTNYEIRSISTITEFYNMFPNGRYVVVNDLDFTNGTAAPNFYGQVDFQGHKAILYYSNRTYLFYQLQAGSVFKNAVIEMHANYGRVYGGAIAQYNYGIIEDVIFNVVESTPDCNLYVAGLMTYCNYGTIRRFVVHNQVEVYARNRFGEMAYVNYGLIRDGYIYGEHINATHVTDPEAKINKKIGTITSESNGNSRIENVFSLVSVLHTNDTYEVYAGNLVGQAYTGKMLNCFSVEDDDYMDGILTQDPNFGWRNSMSGRNIFYFSRRAYKGTLSTRGSYLALYDTNFMNTLLNSYNSFEVDSFLSLGFFPQVKLSNCMPNLEYIPLPVLEDADLIDITSVEEESNEGDVSIVLFHMNNPASEKINSIGIQDITTVEILSQTDSFGKSIVRARLSKPMTYKSVYYLRKISSVSALGHIYDTNYGVNEKAIKITMYYKITDLASWRRMRSNPNDNYMLANDLDFEGVLDTNFYINTTFNGILNGNGHVLRNMTLTSSNAYGYGVFYVLNNGATIKNLYIENFKRDLYNSHGAFIYQTGTNNGTSVILDNIHMNNVFVKSSTGYVGGLISYANGTIIENCSVTNFSTSIKDDVIDIVVGGMVGYLYGNGYIQNCFVQDVDIDVTNSFTTNGIGGMVGRADNGNVINAYVTGTVRSNSRFVGGFGGYVSCSITNVWTKVNVYTNHDYVGGIAGYRGSSLMSSTLLFGDISSTYSGNFISRTAGNTLLIPQKNYYWDMSKYEGFISGYANAERNLSTEQLKNIETYYDLLDFKDSFDYSQIGENIIPKLLSTEGELLPNQKDYYFVQDEFDVSGSIEITRYQSDRSLEFYLDNPNGYEITNIFFDYLTYENKNFRAYYYDDIKSTYVRIDLPTPIRYLDNYVITGVEYINSEGKKEIYDKHIKVDLPYYREISDFATWKLYANASFSQNYVLTGDIDFTGYEFDTISVDRLIGNGHKIMNVTKENISSAYYLFKKVNYEMRDVEFYNINLSVKDTLSGANYFGIIRINMGSMRNVTFNQVNIDGAKNNYVAPIINNRGSFIYNLASTNVYVKGNNYVSGLIATSEAHDGTYLSADHVTIYSTGTYAGSICAYRNTNSNTICWFRLSATNIDITTYSYGGGVFGYGSANYVSIKDSTVTGLSGGNRIGGLAGCFGDHYVYYNTVDNVTVTTPNTVYVGGMAGTSVHTYYSFVRNTNVYNYGTGTTYTGGFFGHSSNTTENIGVINVNVESYGVGGTGGIFGYFSGYMNRMYVNNVDVKGVSFVGGASGRNEGNSRIYNSVINARVTGTGSRVGGIYGSIASVWLDDKHTTTSQIGSVILENAEITGNDYVGFLSGYAPDVLRDTYFYNVLLVGKITTTSEHAFTGVMLPEVFADELDDSHGYTVNLPRIYVYDQNTINGVRIQDIEGLDMTMSFSHYATAAELATQSFYSSKVGGMRYTDQSGVNLVDNGYYPIANISNGADVIAVEPNVFSAQLKISYPTAAPAFDGRSGLSAASFVHELPTPTVYSSGVDTINVEFDDSDPYTLMTIYENGEEVYSDTLRQRVYTLNYNYTSEIKIVLSDVNNSTTYNYYADDLRSPVASFDNTYAYIYDGKLKSNKEVTDDNYIHLYDQYALTDDCRIYDLKESKFISGNTTINLSVRSSAKSLFEFDLGASKIDTYAKFSVIHKSDGDVIYDGQIFYRNGSLEIVDKYTENVKTSVIIDSYGKKNYLSVLGLDGSIYHLKTEVDLPSGFTNSGIKYMSNNVNNNSNMIVVMYDTGRVVVFDYRTGSQKVEEKATSKISIVQYLKENMKISKIFGQSENASNYNRSVELARLLDEHPISMDNKGNYSFGEKSTNDNIGKYQLSSNYVTYYNSVRDDYDVIDLGQVVFGDEKEVVSETDKIFTSDDLVRFYMNESLMQKVSHNVSITILLSIVLFSVIISLILVFTNYYKERKKES